MMDVHKCSICGWAHTGHGNNAQPCNRGDFTHWALIARMPSTHDLGKKHGGSPATLCDFHPNGGFYMSRLLTVIGALVALLAVSPAPAKAEKSILFSSTTSTQDSGLFGHILPMFKAKTGIDVKVVAQGTGQALDTGRRGDADVVFVHAKPQEEKFIA